MSQANTKVHKKNEGNHDGCADCVRQKKENEAFIKIYERLQEVQKKTGRVKQAVNEHKTNSDTNRSFYRSYEQKMINLPKVKEKENPIQMQFSGYQIAASLIEKQQKSKLMTENRRLKDILFKMQKDKNYERTQAEISINRLPKNDETLNNKQSLSQSFAFQQNGQSLYSNKSELQKLTNSQETSESCKDNSSTQSSSFNMSKMRNSMDLSKYNDLNLWLYENKKNAKLQEQLYVVKHVTNRSFVSKRTNSLLPSIRK